MSEPCTYMSIRFTNVFGIASACYLNTNLLCIVMSLSDNDNDNENNFIKHKDSL